MNMRQDLKKGDLIRRITQGSDKVVQGKTYTFDSYSTGDVKLKGIDGLWHASNFEFVARGGELIITANFENAKVGDKLYYLGIGEVEVSNVDMTNTGREIEVIFRDSDDDSVRKDFSLDGICRSEYHTKRTLFHKAPTFETPVIEIIVQKDNLFRAEFIEAMKKTAKEYIDGTHDWDGEACELCKTMRKVLGVTNNSRQSCKKVCPWVIITGATCSQNKTGIERAAELLEWIQTYEKALEEGK